MSRQETEPQAAPQAPISRNVWAEGCNFEGVSGHTLLFHDAQRNELWDKKKLAIARIVEAGEKKGDNPDVPGVSYSAMMPNPDNMRAYTEDWLRKQTVDRQALMRGPYHCSWGAPCRRWRTRNRRQAYPDLPEDILPAIPKKVDAELLEQEQKAQGGEEEARRTRETLQGVMMGFDMKRPAVASTRSYSYTCEPECRRPCTSGLPPLNEEQIRCVENIIKWFRQRRCISWARGLMAAGCTRTLVSTACNQAWSEWYSEPVCATLKSTPTWKLIQRSCNFVAQKCISFLCGAHPRAGKNSPLSILGVDVLRHILMLFGRFRFNCDLDGMFREPPPTEFENALNTFRHQWPPASKLPICAFGNFDTELTESHIALNSLVFAYTLVYEFGPWISLDDFVSAVEAGSVGDLRCFAFLRVGAYARTPQERFMAIRLYETLFGVLPASEESKFHKCFTGDGFVQMADNSLRRVRDVCVGDYVKTESGMKRICRVERKTINDTIPMCEVSGVWLTPGHPVFVDGTWQHPFEITTVRTVIVDELFNFELSGGPMSPDHSVFINGLLVCTLGKDCGKRIVGGWPKADQLAGTGYWRNGSSSWSRSLDWLLLTSA